jgi:ATP-dependent helicase HrpB
MAETEGSCLAFLPGEGEIRRVARLLAGRLPPDVRSDPLYGALPFRDQRAAIRPEAEGRKLVLATSIAETSLTIEACGSWSMAARRGARASTRPAA